MGSCLLFFLGVLGRRAGSRPRPRPRRRTGARPRDRPRRREGRGHRLRLDCRGVRRLALLPTEAGRDPHRRKGAHRRSRLYRPPFPRADGPRGRWTASRKGRALLNFGASVSHGTLRVHAMPQYAERVKALGSSAEAEAARELRDGLYAPLPEERTEALHQLFEKGLREGGLGIGMPHQYYPGADRREIFRVFEFAAEKDVPIYTHVRSIGVEAMQEVIADAAATGASLHIVHVNSMSLWDLPLVLEIIEGARKRGVDVSTEAYPYTAGSTSIESPIFDEGWQERLRIPYGH